MEDVLGIGPGKLGRERHIERVVDRGIDGGGGRYRRDTLRSDLLVRVYARHSHVVRSRHAEAGTHPLGPVTHVRQLIHGGRGGTGKEGRKETQSRYVVHSNGRVREVQKTRGLVEGRGMKGLGGGISIRTMKGNKRPRGEKET